MGDDFLYLFQQVIMECWEEEVEIWAMLEWAVWNARNIVLFWGQVATSFTILGMAQTLLHDHKQATVHSLNSSSLDNSHTQARISEADMRTIGHRDAALCFFVILCRWPNPKNFGVSYGPKQIS